MSINIDREDLLNAIGFVPVGSCTDKYGLIYKDSNDNSYRIPQGKTISSPSEF